MSRCRSRRAWCLSLGLALMMLVPPSPSSAQFGGTGGRSRPGQACRCHRKTLSDTSGTLKEPTAFRVYQRDRNGRADIPIVLADASKSDSIVSAGLFVGKAGPTRARR